MLKYLVWALLLIPVFIIGLVFHLLSPIACLFIVRQPYGTIVKRMGKTYQLLDRDRLVWWLAWFDTFDNATDEYWYGMYGFDDYFTQADYDECVFCRWLYRVLWLQRNSAYGFLNRFGSIDMDSNLAWHFKGNIPIGFGYQMNVNVGWKEHEGSDVLMYAGRPVGKITKKKG